MVQTIRWFAPEKGVGQQTVLAVLIPCFNQKAFGDLSLGAPGWRSSLRESSRALRVDETPT